MKILLDTNIILDVFLSRDPHVEAAEKIFKLIFQGKIRGYTNASSITDIYYIVAKRLGDKPAREALRNLFNLIEIISVDGDDCIRALNLAIDDFEDALIAVSADKIKIDHIVTNDTKFLNVDSELAPTMTADDFLLMYSAD
jgi:predicted nucleic acid-binding protein